MNHQLRYIDTPFRGLNSNWSKNDANVSGDIESSPQPVARVYLSQIVVVARARVNIKAGMHMARAPNRISASISQTDSDGKMKGNSRVVWWTIVTSHLFGLFETY